MRTQRLHLFQAVKEERRRALGVLLEQRRNEHRLALDEDGLHIPYRPPRRRMERLSESSWDMSSLL